MKDRSNRIHYEEGLIFSLIFNVKYIYLPSYLYKLYTLCKPTQSNLLVSLERWLRNRPYSIDEDRLSL